MSHRKCHTIKIRAQHYNPLTIEDTGPPSPMSPPPWHWPGVSPKPVPRVAWPAQFSVFTTTFQNSDKTQMSGEGRCVHHHHLSPGPWWSSGHQALLWLVTSLTHWPVIGRNCDLMWQSLSNQPHAVNRTSHLPPGPALSHTSSLGTGQGV